MAIELHHGLCVDTLFEDGVCTPVDIKTTQDVLKRNGYERIRLEFTMGHMVETWEKRRNNNDNNESTV